MYLSFWHFAFITDCCSTSFSIKRWFIPNLVKKKIKLLGIVIHHQCWGKEIIDRSVSRVLAPTLIVLLHPFGQITWTYGLDENKVTYFTCFGSGAHVHEKQREPFGLYCPWLNLSFKNNPKVFNQSSSFGYYLNM